MRLLLFVITLIVCSNSVSAQPIAVLRGDYSMVMEDERSEAKARIVADTVCKAVENADLMCRLVDTECQDASCVSKTAKSMALDQAVVVSTAQTGAQYAFRVFTTDGLVAKLEKTGAMSDALNDLTRLVQETIAAPIKHRETSGETAPSSKNDPAESEIEDETAGQAPSSAEPVKRKPLVPVAFWTAFGVTLAAAGSAAIIESIGYTQWQRFKDKPPEERSASEKDRLSSMRTANRVLGGISAAGLVTTIVFAPLTDFGGKSRLKAAFGPLHEGGAFFVGGEF